MVFGRPIFLKLQFILWSAISGPGRMGTWAYPRCGRTITQKAPAVAGEGLCSYRRGAVWRAPGQASDQIAGASVGAGALPCWAWMPKIVLIRSSEKMCA